MARDQGRLQGREGHLDGNRGMAEEQAMAFQTGELVCPSTGTPLGTWKEKKPGRLESQVCTGREESLLPGTGVWALTEALAEKSWMLAAWHVQCVPICNLGCLRGAGSSNLISSCRAAWNNV
jgi:hypothetical protein